MSYTRRPNARPQLGKALALVGRLLISAGLVVFAFAAYELWGTGLLQAQRQDQLESDFARFSETAAAAVATTVRAPLPDGPGSVVGPPVENEVGVVSAVVPTVVVDRTVVERAAGAVVGRLAIPSIDLEQYIVEGIEPQDLEKGPGHFPDTPMPGLSGNSALAGHRTTWGAPFNRIDELRPGDEISVSLGWGEAVYRVLGHLDGEGTERGYFIVDPSETWVLDQDGGDRLTLTSCHPKYSARQRIIVTAELISTPVQLSDPLSPQPTGAAPVAVTPEGEVSVTEQASDSDSTPTTQAEAVAEAELPSESTTSFGDGLGGDESALAPAIAWTAAALLVWATASVASRRWRMVASYLIAALPLATLWFIAFGYIDQLLPS